MESTAPANVLLPGDILRRSAGMYANRPAVTVSGRTITFGQLYERACRLANALLGSGLRPGDRVAMLGDNSLRSLEQIAALALANLVRCPLFAGGAVDGHLQMLGDVEASGLIVDRRHREQLGDRLAEVPSVRTVIVDDDADYERLLDNAPASHPGVGARPDDPHIIRFSAGTTGRAKGILHTTRGWLRMGDEYLAMGTVVNENDRYLAGGPLSHASGLIIWPLVSVGACHVLTGSFDAGEFLRIVARERCTIAFVVPTMIQALLAHSDAATADLSSLRVLGYGGAPISASTVAAAMKLWGPVLYGYYGQSESLPITILEPRFHVLPDGAPDPERLRSVGRPTPRTVVAVLDESGSELPAGEIGQIAAIAPGNMAGIWADPDATAERLTPAGHVKTGDIGYQDADGFVYLLDRLSDVIISGGFNIWPAELENCLYAHPAVEEAAVFGVPHEKWGETPLAVVLCRNDATAGEQELIDWCRERLGPVKKPTRIVFTSEPLPKNPVGKIERRTLRDPFWQGRDRAIGDV